MKMTENTMLVTGGASGIGRALAESFHKLGNNVIIAGRRRDLLDVVTAANPGMRSFSVDLSDARAIETFAREVLECHPALNVVVNNAGIMRAENVWEKFGLRDAEETIAINLLAPLRLTRALLPAMMNQKASTVVNVSSGLAFVPLAMTPTYCATKAALHSYTQCLRHQLRGTSVEVIEIVPPAIQTDLMPGMKADAKCMPLAAFVDEVMSLLTRPSAEVCVERVGFLRDADAQGRYAATFDILNGEH